MNTYLITGAAGYIGAMIVKYIRMIDEKADITALVRNKAKAEKVLPYNVQIAEVDLTDGKKAASLNLDCDYLIHCASITGSAEMLAHPVEVTESIINTTQNVLELARRCQLKSMVYLSSMEVYGNIDCPIGHRVTEKEVSRGQWSYWLPAVVILWESAWRKISVILIIKNMVFRLKLHVYHRRSEKGFRHQTNVSFPNLLRQSEKIVILCFIHGDFRWEITAGFMMPYQES